MYFYHNIIHILFSITLFKHDIDQVNDITEHGQEKRLTEVWVSLVSVAGEGDG